MGELRECRAGLPFIQGLGQGVPDPSPVDSPNTESAGGGLNPFQVILKISVIAFSDSWGCPRVGLVDPCGSFPALRGGGDYPEKTGTGHCLNGLWWAWEQMKVVQRAGNVSPGVPELALPLSVPRPGKIPILVLSRCQREQRLRVKLMNWQGLGNYRCA